MHLQFLELHFDERQYMNVSVTGYSIILKRKVCTM